jgi:hypothetical protein
MCKPCPIAVGNAGVRLTLLATSAIIAVTPALAAPPEEVRTGRSLTAGPDLLGLALSDYSIDRSPDVFGLAPAQRIIGIDALGGNDDLLLAGSASVEGSLSQTRIYANLPIDLPTLTLFTESPLTRIAVIGADAGAGNDALCLGGRLTVDATGSFNLGKLDMDVSVPTTLTPDSLTADLDVIATGLADNAGNNRLAVDGRLESQAAATGTRTELNISLANLSNQPQLLTGTADATGLLTGGGADNLAIGTNGTVTATADSEVISTDVTIAGLVVGSPESAAVANGIARVIDAGAGDDVLVNAGRAEAKATARLIETGIAVVAAGYTLPEILVPDASPESGATARALGLIGGLGIDRITNSGALTLSADTTLIRTSIAFTDAGIDGTAIEMLVEPPTFPDEPGRGAVARVAGIVGDDTPLGGTAAGANHDIIINSGSITGDAKADMTTTAVQIAVPINEATGVSDTTAGKLIDAISIGLTDDASAAAAAFATGITGGSGLDTISHGGAIALTAVAEADTGQFKLDVSSFLEPSEEEGAGDSSEASFNLSLDVFNTGAFAIAETSGIDGGTGNDRIATLAGSTLTAASSARARTLDADITVSKDDKAFNLGGSVVFSLSLAGATTIGITGGAGIDTIDSAGSIDVAADALVQALKANVKVDVVKTGLTLNAQMIDADMQSTSAATGILAGDLADQVSAGSIKARATSDVESIAVAVNVAVATEKGVAGTGSFLTTAYRSEASAIGVDRFTLDPTNFPRPLPSGIALGRTILRDGAVVDIGADAAFQRVGVAANVGAAKKGAAIAASIFELEADGTASAFGLRGSLFEDQVTSGATITSSASVDGLSSETALAVAGGESGVAAGVGLVLADSSASAVARGIDLGGGTNSLLATAPISATANAANTANANSVSVEGAKQGVAVGAAVVKIDTAARADAAAISSEAGDDAIDARGALVASASSDADIIAVTLGVSGAMDGVGAGAGVILADGSATARAAGIDSGAGNDRVTLSGAVLASATTTLDSVGVGVTVAGAKNGVGAGASVLSTRFGSDSSAFGASLGSGNDQLVTTAAMSATGIAANDVKSVAISITGALDGVGIGAGVVLADVMATGRARAADLGDGDDSARFGAGLAALATATAANTGAGVSVSGANNGVGAGAAAVVNTTLATADAAALVAGDGADSVTLRGAGAAATATTTTLNIAASVAGANNGVGAGAGVILADAGSQATATTVDLGAGADRATLDERLTATGAANTSTTGVGVSIAGANNGVAVGASVISADVSADAIVTALAAGSGDDSIDGRGRLSSSATAAAANTSASVGVTGAVNGVAAGAAVALADTSAAATSSGAALGSGNDVLVLAGGADSSASANARSTSVGVQLSGTYQGVGAGVALVDSSTEAVAAAIAADGGDGNDRLDLGGPLSSAATASASNLGVSVGLGFSVFGVGAGGAGVLGTVDSLADATGLGGGAGGDTLIARDNVTVTSTSTAQQTSVAVSASFAVGVALSASYIDSSLSATATATGLAGDSGPGGGNDILTSSRGLTVGSTASATGASYSFAFAIGVGLGANILTSGTSSLATAIGQSGGDGNDGLSALGDAAVTASARSTGSSLSLTLTGANIGDMSNDAGATAIGLDGGNGNDTITATGIVAATASATADASSIGIGFTGATIADISNSGSATAVAIAGGDGNDVIVSDRRAAAIASSSSDIDTVTVQLTGAGQATLGSTTVANAIAIDGGAGDDVIRARDSRATATAALTGDSYGITAVGAAGQDSSLAATAQATGIDGGNGRNSALLTDTSAVAGATATPAALAVTLTGVNAATLGSQASAIATGYRGGSARDEVQLNGSTTASSTATASSDRIGISLTGADIGTTQLNANADSAFARSGDGGDAVVTSGALSLDATADARTKGTIVSIVGAIDATLGARAIGRGTGLAGGTGADVLALGGGINGTVAAVAQSDADAVAVVGAAIARSRNIADAAIAAIDGGSGSDQLQTGGSVILTATSTVRNDRLDVTGAGANAAFGGMDSLARASGIDTGAGDLASSVNSASNSGLLRLTATAGISDVNTAITLAGASIANASALIRATTAGLTGNAGRDTLANSGTLTLAATAGGGTQRTSVTLIGATNVTNTTGVFATVGGLAGGDGNDILRNSGTLTGTATALARSSSLSAGLVGATLANADNSVDARITGLDGGAGADTISMDGTLALTSFATGTGADRSATLVGGSVNSARTLASSTTLGITGGSGADTIIHSGFSTLLASSQISAVARALVLVGAASGEADMLAGATGVGIDGGADDDLISVAAGSGLTLDAAARLTSVASSLNLAGLASSGGIGGATATALGIAGGSGNDGITIAGLVDVGGTANLDVQASNFTLLGAVAQAGRFRATVTATGVEAGIGNDSIAFTGVGNVTGIATASYRASGLSAVGAASSDAAIGATARALGLGGGSGTNSITLDSTERTPFGVLARADSSLATGSQVFLGAAVSNGAASSLSTATGIATDSGNDTILVDSALGVTGRAGMSFESASFAFVGAAGGATSALVRSVGTGIEAGTGSNGVTTGDNADIEVDVLVDARGSAAAGAAIGSANAAAVTRGEAVANGITSGNGIDSFNLGGTLNVKAGATIYPSVVVNSGALFADGIARASASGELIGGLLVDAGGATSVTVRSEARLTLAVGVPPGVGLDGTMRADATSNGVAGGIDVDAFANASTRSRTLATGIGLGICTGNSVGNAGVIDVIGAGVVDARAFANGNAGVSGDATATASGTLADSAGRGVASAARLTLINSKSISVEMRPVALAQANGGANGLGVVDPDARATATANASNTVASAVEMGGGTLVNTGLIEAVSAPRAEAVAGARPSGSFNTSIDAFATATAAVDAAQAYGIRSNTNAVTIENSGEIIARATPRAIARAGAFGNGADGDATATALVQTVGTLAVGIDLVTAGSSITNTGSILAVASADNSALPEAVRSGNGSRVATPLTVTSTSSYGIRATGGNNSIVNRGSISGTWAIQTGSGVDTVSLLGGSTSGLIDLGAGNDSITIRNTPVVAGQLIGGTGSDLITIDGGVTLGGGISGFERLVKTGAGQANFGFIPWSPSEFSRIEAGRIFIQGGLQQTGHKLTTLIYSNGSLGALASGSTATFAPRGALIVELGDTGVFVNKSSWDVIESAGQISVAQLTVALPEPTALRTFTSSLAAGNTRYRVQVAVQSMAGVAAPGIAASYGAALDAATPMATGAVADTVAALQAIPSAEALRNRLSADAPALPTRSLAVAGAMLDSALAVSAAAPSGLGVAAPASGLMIAGQAAGIGAPGRWSAAFTNLPGSNAGIGQGNGIGYASGVTTMAGDTVELGVGTVWMTRDAQFTAGAGRSEATIVTGRLRVAPTPTVRMATGFAAGRSRFDGSRGIAGGGLGINRQTGGLLAIDSELAWSPAVSSLNPSLGASVSYRRVDGDTMREGGAGLALLVDRSHWQRAETRVGLTLAPEWVRGNLRFTSRLGAYWAHRLGGAQDGVEARFAAMPDHRFTLSNGSLPRDSLAFDAGFGLGIGRWSLNAAATSRADVGSRWTEGRVTLGLAF